MKKTLTDNASSERPCAHCGPGVRLTKDSLAKLLADYLNGHDDTVVDDGVYVSRLAECMKCADLLDGCTCRHCGCFVQIRAKLAAKACPSPAGEKW